MLNNVTIQGRLTRDPELRYTSSQTPVVSFTIACDRDYNREETDFIECVAWRSTAEFISKYYQKGSMAIINGRLQIRDWEDKEGNKRRNTEVIVENVYFGGSKKQNQEEPLAPEFTEVEDGDGDLPF